MKGRRKSDRGLKPILVKLDDGTVLRATVSSIGREAQPRWVLMAADGIQYAGPEATGDKSPESVQQLVSEWWAAQKPAEKPTAKSGKRAGKPAR
jgi:hypothetical protein